MRHNLVLNTLPLQENAFEKRQDKIGNRYKNKIGTTYEPWKILRAKEKDLLGIISYDSVNKVKKAQIMSETRNEWPA